MMRSAQKCINQKLRCVAHPNPGCSRKKQNVSRILDEFLAQDTEGLATSWKLLSAPVLCDKPFYERVSNFLMHVYVIPQGVKHAGLPLACQSVLN